MPDNFNQMPKGRFSLRSELRRMIGAMNDGIGIAASGLAAASLWLTATASNIANMNDAAPAPDAPPGAPAAYQPLTVSQTPLPDGGVSASLQPRLPASTLAYDPSAPFANLQGMVTMPNVDLATEFTQLIQARESFRANLAVFKTSSGMFQTLLDMTA
ncbi:MAG TPA: flagellar basal body rod C-terminal domain-containing protein [Rhizomicrobium sp.]|nr:flagellar basal body rod C-terminal domain-containing protein [Rhizomicrobium sp.]